MQEILPDIYTWPWFSERHGYDFNGYLIRTPAGNLCIDPPAPNPSDLEAIAELGATRILLSNRNHSRAANALRERTGARTAMHPDDAEHARREGAIIDDALGPGETIGPLTVVAASGKSPGEVAFHWPGRRLLIVGDIVIGNPPGQLGLLPDRVMDDPAGLRESVRRLLALDFDAVLVGDGASVLEHAKARLEALVASFGE